MRAALLALIPTLLAAQASPEHPVPARVRVYPDQAWVTREASVTFKAPGSRRLTIPGLPPGLALGDIRVEALGISGLRLGNVAVTTEDTPYEPDAAARALETERDGLTRRASDLEQQRKALAATREILGSLTPEGAPADGAALPDPKAVMDLGRALQSQQDALFRRDQELEASLKQVMQRIEDLQADLDGRRARVQRRTSTLWIELDAPAAGEVRVVVENRTSYARWQPTYEARLAPGGTRLELLCYAQVSQASGEDWRDVQMEVSNAEPGRILALPTVPPSLQVLYEAPGIILTGAVEGRVTDTRGAILGGATVRLESKLLHAPRTIVSDARGTFRFPLLTPGEYQVMASKNGLSSAMTITHVQANRTASLGIQLSHQTQAGAVVEVVASYSSADKSEARASYAPSLGASPNRPVAAQGPGLQPVELPPVVRFEESGELGRAWSMDVRRTLAADAHPVRILIARDQVEARLNLVAVPRASTEVFLLATPPTHAGFPWFPGAPAAIFRGGERLGQTGLPRVLAGEGAAFSFGPMGGVRTQRTTLEATVSTPKALKGGRQWTLRERVVVVNELDHEVEVDVREPAVRSASDKVRIEPLAGTTPVTLESNGNLVWHVKVPARGQAAIEEGWRITGPGVGRIPELAALGLPTSD